MSAVNRSSVAIKGAIVLININHLLHGCGDRGRLEDEASINANLNAKHLNETCEFY